MSFWQRSPLPYPTHSHSALYQQFYGLGSRLLVSEAGLPSSLLVTSSQRYEGRSFVALNLASQLALRARPVLLIDADPIGQGLTRRFGLENEPGLFDCLAEGGAQPELHSVPAIEGLQLLGVGDCACSDPIQLLQNGLSERLAEWGPSFDLILLDGAPLSEEARVVARTSKGVLVVVRAFATSNNRAAEACNTLRHAGANLLGTVFNAYREYVPRVIRQGL